MAKRGKRYEAAAAKIDRDKVYSPSEAMTLIKETTTVSFDPTVEVALRLGVDPRKADQMVRGSVILPSGTGKTNRVAVFAEGPKATEASEAGADIVGSDTLVEMIEAGNLDFDVVIATPDQMGKVGRFGKVLGPRKQRGKARGLFLGVLAKNGNVGCHAAASAAVMRLATSSISAPRSSPRARAEKVSAIR